MNQEKAQAAKPVPEDGLRPSRLDSANIFSRLTVYWVSPLISLAYKRRLEMIDVEDVPGRLHSEELGYELERKWTGNFFTTMRRVFLGDFGWIIIPFLILSASSTTTPFLVQMFLRYLSAPQGSESGLNGWAIVCLIGLVGIVQAFAINTGFLLSSVLAVRIRSAVANMVFRKAVKLSSASRASLSSGDVLNLMSQDCERIFFAVLLGHTLWWAALMMLIVAIVLLIEIGIAGVAAVLFALCLVPVTSKIAAMIGREKRKMLKYTDERVSISSEVLQGIQTVKMQNWEEFIKNKVFAMREKEMVHGKRVLQLLALNAWQVFMVPPLMAAMCFGVLAATNPDRLNVATIYAILAFLNTLLLPLDLIPRAAGTFAQALVSIKRIEMFMALKDVASIDSSSLAFGGNRERIPGGEADGSSPISSFLFNKPNAHETDTKANVDADTPSNGEDVFIEQNQGEVPSAIVVDDPDRGNRAITDSSVILSMTNCTFFWTRRKDDDSYDRKKKRQTKKRLQRGVSMKQTLKTFSSSAKYARQQSLSWATSFRTGPIFKPMAEEDEVGDPEEKSHPAHHDQIVEMEEVEVLKGVTLKVARGELVVIVGEVGSGKTSLLQGVLGEIGLRPEGQLQWRVNCTGDKPSIAYVPQEPWIQNDTMKNNILFIKSRPVDEDLYRDTISAVQMIPDLTTLPKGDNTEIGSRGINLSGGQKARVGLARAVYHALVQKKQADEEVVVCCDDPFSALDPNVANSVWHEVVQGLLTGFTRIVCLNSNLSLASKADRLIVLEDGVITAQGRPDDILADSKFAWLFDARDAAEHDQPASEEQAANSTSDLSSSSTTSADIEPIQAPISPRKPAETAVGPTEGVGKLYKAEERAQGTVSIKTYWNWLRSGSFKDSPSFSLGLIIFLYLFTQALKVFADLWLGTWSRSDQFSNKSLGLGIYFGVVSVMVVSSLVRALVFTSVSARASVRLHRDLITNIMRAPVNLFFDVTPVGRILNRLSSDMDHIDTKLPEVALQLLHALSMILGAIIMASYASPYILAILVPLLAIFSQLAKRLSRCQRELKRFDGMSRSPLFSHFGETLSGLTTIRSFKVAAEFRAENSRLIDTNARFFFLFWMTARWLALRVDLLAVICQFSICALALGTKTPGQNTAVIGLAVTYSLLLTTTVQACTRYVVETENSMIACERILDLISNVPQERNDGSDDFSVTEGDVEFENVSSRYRPNLDLCIKNVSFKVKGGQRVGLCGRSGSGKSTLGNILFGMMSVEPGGRLLFDGVDSATVSLKRLRSQMSVIPQTPVIFSGTIRFAIDPWSYCQSDAELWAVLQAVEMDGFVKSFPGQLDGRLDENASSLSVGERQLLCVARALLRKSKIVLLDESTASVDAHSDVVVQRAVEEGFRGATIFVIAHRLHTIVQSDLIVVMEQGRLKEFGSPSQLLQMRDGSFKKMWDLENRKQQEPT